MIIWMMKIQKNKKTPKKKKRKLKMGLKKLRKN